MIENCNRINDSRISKVMNHFINNFSDKGKNESQTSSSLSKHLTINKKIVLMIFLALLILPVVSALVGTDESGFSMAGCEDKTLLGRCSDISFGGIGKPFFCNISATGFNLTPNCGLNSSSFCACPSEAIVCGKDRDCTTVENKKALCASHNQNSDDCVTLGGNIIGGVCFWNTTEPKCKACPDLGYFDCSYYTNNGGEDACELDSCFLGKSGLGVGIYESEVTFVNYYREWYNNECVLSYNTQDPAGNKCNCRTTQKLSECIDDEATLTWTKVCTNTTADTHCVTNITQPRTTPISCGKATSPLPFFSFFNFVAVLSFLLVYYAFKIKKEGKKK